MNKIAYVGIDYHQSFLAVAVLPKGGAQPVDEVKLDPSPRFIDNLRLMRMGRCTPLPVLLNQIQKDM